MNLKIVDNIDRKRFEAEVDGDITFMEYIRAKDAIYLTHTEVPKSLEGKGVGNSMVKEVLTLIKEEGIPMAPLCPFVALFLSRHPEWKSLLAKGYNV